MKKPHGLTGRSSNAQKDAAPRTGRLSLRLPPDVDAALAARVGPGCTKSDAALQILRRGLECWCPRCESSVLPVDGKGDSLCPACRLML